MNIPNVYTLFVYTHENNACDSDNQLLSTVVIYIKNMH